MQDDLHLDRFPGARLGGPRVAYLPSPGCRLRAARVSASRLLDSPARASVLTSAVFLFADTARFVSPFDVLHSSTDLRPVLAVYV